MGQALPIFNLRANLPSPSPSPSPHFPSRQRRPSLSPNKALPRHPLPIIVSTDRRRREEAPSRIPSPKSSSQMKTQPKFNLTLCGRCFVCSNDRNEISAGDFRRVEVSEETKTGWTDKETLHLLEAITHYGDDWKKVAMHVGGRSEKECVAHFLKLPFGEQFVCHPDSEEVDKYSQTKNHGDAETKQEDAFLLSLAKKWHLTSFSDASNPIMAQVAFLLAMVGSEVAEAAAQASVAALSKVDLTVDERRNNTTSPLDETQHKESATFANNDTTMGTLEEAVAESHALVNKEEEDLERSISNIIEVQMKEIQDKIVKFEEVESQMEREWKQLHQMKNLLFADQLTLLFRRTKSPLKIGESTEDVVQITDAAAVT